jgi:hypothetical protein
MAKEKVKDEINKADKPLPLWLMVILPIYTGAFLALLILPVSKDWGWFEAWAFIITFVINITISYAYINKKNPRVMRNRMKVKKEGLTAATRKSAGSDRFLMPIMSLGFFCGGNYHEYSNTAKSVRLKTPGYQQRPKTH